MLEIPSLPDTNLYRENEMEYEASGFKIKQIQPMKEWQLCYDGKMRYVNCVSISYNFIQF